MSYLSDFSEMVERLGNERRQQQDEALAQAEAEYPAQAARVLNLSGPTLLLTFEVYVSRSFADPRMTAVTQRIADVCRVELLARLAGTRPLNPVTANSN